MPAIGRLALSGHAAALVPLQEDERYARHWPQARLLGTHRLGRSPVLGEPDVSEAALRFLRGEAAGERVVSSPNPPLVVA